MPVELLIELRCPGCGTEQLFEQPPCADGHGADCPERACVTCGTAIILGTSWPVETSYDASGEHASPSLHAA